MGNKKLIAVSMLVLLTALLLGGCGTVGGEVAKVTAPDRATTAGTTSINGTLITFNDNPTPATDTITGTAGAVDGSSVVYIYADMGQTLLIIQVTAAGDGSFSADLGDDLYFTVFVKAKANGKDFSETVMKTL